MESSFQDASVEFLYVLKDNQLDYNSFISFKNNLFEANYYEDLELNKFHGFSIENSKDESSNFLQINNNLEGDLCLSSVHNLLQCCYFSECVFNILHLAEFLQTYESFSNEFFSSNGINLESELKSLSISQT